MRIISRLAAVAGTFLSLLPPAAAGPITLDQWYTFGFGVVGSPLVRCPICENGVNPVSITLPSDAPWSFSLSTSATLIVTDAFVPGDQFRLFDNGSVLGDTSLPVIDVFDSCDTDISGCLADPKISKGEFALAPGAHELSGTTIQSPFNGGVGYFVVSTVPEPATAALLGIVLPVLWIGRRRDRRAGAPLLIT